MPSEQQKKPYYTVTAHRTTKNPYYTGPKNHEKWSIFRGGAPVRFYVNGFETAKNPLKNGTKVVEDLDNCALNQC